MKTSDLKKDTGNGKYEDQDYSEQTKEHISLFVCAKFRVHPRPLIGAKQENRIIEKDKMFFHEIPPQKNIPDSEYSL